MKNKKFYEAMEGINDELLLEAIEEPKRKHRPLRKIKWTFLAAAIFLLASVPVVAEVFELDYSFNETAKTYDYTTNAKIKESELSEELRNSITKEINYFFFDSLKEAEEFIGISFPKNRALVAKSGFSTDENGNETEFRYKVYVIANENKEAESVTCNFFTWNGDVISYIFTTDKASFDGGLFFYKNSGDQRSSEPEKYITSAGYECFITNVFSNGCFHSSGILVVNRTLVKISSLGNTVANAKENLIEKLELFE